MNRDDIIDDVASLLRRPEITTQIDVPKEDIEDAALLLQSRVIDAANRGDLAEEQDLLDELLVLRVGLKDARGVFSCLGLGAACRLQAGRDLEDALKMICKAEELGRLPEVGSTADDLARTLDTKALALDALGRVDEANLVIDELQAHARKSRLKAYEKRAKTLRKAFR